MSVLYKIKISLLSLFLGSISFLYAEVQPHKYDIESAMVIYEITGGGQLTPETNLTIEGNATVLFKEWGTVELVKENGFVIATGAIKNKQNIQSIEKTTADEISTVDFKTEKLLVRKKNATDEIKPVDETEGLRYVGKETIDGIDCDIWEGTGVKKCIYKGVVLHLESNVLGISYVKRAKKIMVDINTSNEDYALLDYPAQEFSLFKDNIQTKTELKKENFCKILKDVACGVDTKVKEYSKIDTIDDNKRITFINDLGQNIYQRQKKILTKLLKSMKKTRECLQFVESPFDANQCIEAFSHMKEELGTEENEFIILWDEKRKDVFLDKLENSIFDLQARMPCINRAKNISDLSTCMK